MLGDMRITGMAADTTERFAQTLANGAQFRLNLRAYRRHAIGETGYLKNC
jgi:hypothetical protein